MRIVPCKTNRSWITALILMLGLAFFTSPGWGQTNEYETIARNFLLFLGSDKEIVSTMMIRSNELAPSQPEADIGFLAKLDQGGYILVSTSRAISPVKAYSLTGNFDTLPEAYRRYLLLEAESRVRNPPASGRHPLALSETEKSWDFLLRFDPALRAPLDYTANTFLLKTQWNQGAPYNRFLPEIDGKNALAGCVNVAMAQIMKYHGHPAMGKGVSSYVWNGSELEAVLSRPYAWGNMPDVVGLAELEYKADEVALLLRDLAIMNKTSFGLDESSASGEFQAMAEHFGYSRNIGAMANTDTAFFGTLRGEIANLRPVLLEFPGHMTVADGYIDDSTGKTIHVNMGWGGNHDAFYYLDDPVVIDADTVFDPTLTIRYNITPCSGDDCIGNLESGDALDNLTITGIFDYALDVDRFDLYLKGTTTISGLREYYGENSFYISIYDSNRLLLKSDSNPFTLNDLLPGLYTLRISLASEAGWAYSFDEAHTNYTVNITTTALTAEEKADVDGNLDIPPFIGNTLKDRLFNSSAASPYRILIDARDENGDAVSLSVRSTNTAAIGAAMEGNILALTPVQGASQTAGSIVVTAAANGKKTEKSFIAMVDNRDVAFGKSFAISGLFESQEDRNAHQVILDGACTITGDNGYDNQGFYTSVLTAQGEIVSAPADTQISKTFDWNVYTIHASLQEIMDGYIYSYPYEQGVTDQYQLTVSCPDADEQTLTVAALLGIDLSKTTINPFGDLDGNRTTNIADAVICIQVMAGMNPDALRDDFPSSGVDVNNDGKIGLQEAVYILQKTAELR